MFTSGHLVSQRVEGVRVSLHEAGWLRGPGGRCPGGGNPAEPPGGDGGGEKEGWKRRTAGLETGTHEPPQRPERAVRRGVQAGTQPQLPACCSFARSPGPAQPSTSASASGCSRQRHGLAHGVSGDGSE